MNLISIHKNFSIEVSMKHLGIIIILVLTLLTHVSGQVPTLISVNGYLINSTGEAVNDSLPMKFRLYADSLGGIDVWNQSFLKVGIKNGIYKVDLDLAGFNFDKQYWLETVVNSIIQSPRTRLTSVPYSLSLRLPFEGRTSSSTYALSVVNMSSGDAIIGSANQGYGVYGQSDSNGVGGLSLNGYGINGLSVNGIGVTGKHFTTGNFGNLGTSSYGVYGKHNSSGNYGYLGSGTIGVGGFCGGYGSGVKGEAATSGFGVYGINSSSGNYGLLGTLTYGVYGKALSVGGYAGYFDGQVYVNGNVGIGTTTPFYKLDVCGTIRGKEVRVETEWCDYVFEPNYSLMPLSQLEQYVNKNKHLPGITPASVVESEGLKVGEMSSKLMLKIEELTLYLIQQNKELQSLREKNSEQEKQIKQLADQMSGKN